MEYKKRAAARFLFFKTFLVLAPYFIFQNFYRRQGRVYQFLTIVFTWNDLFGKMNRVNYG